MENITNNKSNSNHVSTSVGPMQKSADFEGFEEAETYLDIPPPPAIPCSASKSREKNQMQDVSPTEISNLGTLGTETFDIVGAANVVLQQKPDDTIPVPLFHSTLYNRTENEKNVPIGQSENDGEISSQVTRLQNEDSIAQSIHQSSDNFHFTAADNFTSRQLSCSSHENPPTSQTETGKSQIYNNFQSTNVSMLPHVYVENISGLEDKDYMYSNNNSFGYFFPSSNQSDSPLQGHTMLDSSSRLEALHELNSDEREFLRHQVESIGHDEEKRKYEKECDDPYSCFEERCKPVNLTSTYPKCDYDEFEQTPEEKSNSLDEDDDREFLRHQVESIGHDEEKRKYEKECDDPYSCFEERCKPVNPISTYPTCEYDEFEQTPEEKSNRLDEGDIIYSQSEVAIKKENGSNNIESENKNGTFKSKAIGLDHSNKDELSKDSSVKKKRPYLKRGSRKEPSSLNKLGSANKRNVSSSPKLNQDDVALKHTEKLKELEEMQNQQRQQLEHKLHRRAQARKFIKEKKEVEKSNNTPFGSKKSKFNDKENDLQHPRGNPNTEPIEENDCQQSSDDEKIMFVSTPCKNKRQEFSDKTKYTHDDTFPSQENDILQPRRELKSKQYNNNVIKKNVNRFSCRKKQQRHEKRTGHPFEAKQLKNLQIEEQWRLIKSMRKRQEVALRVAEKEKETVIAWAANERKAVQDWVFNQREQIKRDRQKASNLIMVSKRNKKQHELKNEVATAVNLTQKEESKKVKSLEDSIQKLKIEHDASKARHRLREKNLKDAVQTKEEEIHQLTEEISLLREKTSKLQKKSCRHKMISRGTNTKLVQDIQKNCQEDSPSKIIDDNSEDVTGTNKSCEKIHTTQKDACEPYHPDTKNNCDKKDVAGIDKKMQEPNSKRQIVKYSNGAQKEMFPDGSSTVIFPNGDVKTVCKNGFKIYYYALAKTTHKTNPDGSEVYEFPNGQTETHLSNGQKNIMFSDGTKKIIFAQGGSSTEFPDGVKVIEYPDGSKEIERI